MIIHTTPEKNRQELNFDHRELLETKILPTARRWLGIPALAGKGATTLAFWGEDITVPDSHTDHDGRRTVRSEIMSALHFRDEVTE